MNGNGSVLEEVASVRTPAVFGVMTNDGRTLAGVGFSMAGIMVSYVPPQKPPPSNPPTAGQ